jgi:hypothetical protein
MRKHAAVSAARDSITAKFLIQWIAAEHLTREVSSPSDPEQDRDKNYRLIHERSHQSTPSPLRNVNGRPGRGFPSESRKCLGSSCFMEFHTEEQPGQFTTFRILFQFPDKARSSWTLAARGNLETMQTLAENSVKSSPCRQRQHQQGDSRVTGKLEGRRNGNAVGGAGPGQEGD